MWPWIIGGAAGLYLLSKKEEPTTPVKGPGSSAAITPKSVFDSIFGGIRKILGQGAIPACSDPQVTAILQKYYAGKASTADIRTGIQRAVLSNCTATAKALYEVAKSRGYDVSATDLALE